MPIFTHSQSKIIKYNFLYDILFVSKSKWLFVVIPVHYQICQIVPRRSTLSLSIVIFQLYNFDGVIEIMILFMNSFKIEAQSSRFSESFMARFSKSVHYEKLSSAYVRTHVLTLEEPQVKQLRGNFE